MDTFDSEGHKYFVWDNDLNAFFSASLVQDHNLTSFGCELKRINKSEDTIIWPNEESETTSNQYKAFKK